MNGDAKTTGVSGAPKEGGFRGPPPITDETLLNWFSYHAPSDDQIPKFQEIRSAGLQLARAIVSSTPQSADQTAALRKVREAVATANMAIACGGR